MSFLGNLFGKTFLAPLTRDEKVSISNVGLMIYAAIIGEKNGTPANIITDNEIDQAAIPLLRKLEVADIEKLLEAVKVMIEADKAIQQRNLVEAARLFRKAIDFNPYHDLALMSYGTTIGMQGNLREGIKWVEKAVLVNPKNERAKRNLQAMKSKL
jgi:tetratricopeptide (TPR) repeat protein